MTFKNCEVVDQSVSVCVRVCVCTLGFVVNMWRRGHAWEAAAKLSFRFSAIWGEPQLRNWIRNLKGLLALQGKRLKVFNMMLKFSWNNRNHNFLLQLDAWTLVLGKHTESEGLTKEFNIWKTGSLFISKKEGGGVVLFQVEAFSQTTMVLWWCV